ncbi:MAG: Lrp/AsnC family transcriptional regulator [Spirochaetes bacterium]|nr:Lrp/AsnC family transcriptional regulator [Spirochaetota bacterium]
MNRLTKIQQRILNRIQYDIPLSSDPFHILADELCISENDILEELRFLKQNGIIRNISGIFEATSIGFFSTLVAFEVDDWEHASAIINAHPGVSHNYLRNHRFNLWFTLTIPKEWDISRSVHKIATKANARDFLILPTTKRLKIGVHFKIGDENADVLVAVNEMNDYRKTRLPLTVAEKEAIKLLQKDLPIEQKPFRALINAHNGNINETMLFDIGNAFKKDGILRRYCAVLRHHKAGYSANAMTVWKIDTLSEENIIDVFGKNPHISHLYVRQTIPGKWEYPLFAMIHAKSDEMLNSIIENLATSSGICDFCTLKTLKEFKKERIEYFSEEFENWKE